MKSVFPWVVTATVLLTACSGSSDDDIEMEDDWAAQDRATEAKEAEYMKWAMSDDRPVNLACNEPGFSRGQADTYIGLHSFLYPSVESRGEALMQNIRDLRPRTTEPSDAERAAFEMAQQDAAMFAQFGFLATVDVQPRSQFIICSHEQYEFDKCTQMARMMGDDLRLENVALDGDRLSFSAIMPQEGPQTDMEIANPDFDGVTMVLVKDDIPSFEGQWTRAKDGMEHHDSSSEGGQITYRENPDCSGTARWIRPMDNGQLRTMEFEWTSVRDDNFTVTYRDCKVIDGGGQDCTQGTF